MYAKLLRDRKIPRMSLGAICDVDPTRATSADRYGAPFFNDYVAMLDSGSIDAIVTTVPHYLHPSMGIAALQRDIHALVEKPAGVYTSQVNELLAFAQTKPNVTFAIMFNQRTNPLYVDLHALLVSSELGALRHTSWIITTWWRPQAYYDQSEWRATWGGEGGECSSTRPRTNSTCGNGSAAYPVRSSRKRHSGSSATSRSKAK